MYCVLVGNVDSAVSKTDFSVFGPFENKPAADTFVAEWFETVGEDGDEAVVVEFLDPVNELAHERKEREEARAAQQ